MLPNNIAPFWKGSGGQTNSRIFQKAGWTSGLVTALTPDSSIIVADETSGNSTSTIDTSSIKKLPRLQDESSSPPSVHAIFVGRPDGMASAPELLLQQKHSYSPQLVAATHTVALMDANLSMEALTEALDTRMPNTTSAPITLPTSASSSSSTLSVDMRHSHSLTVRTEGLEQYSIRNGGRSLSARYGQWLSVNTPEGKTVDDYGFLCDLTDGEGSSDADGSSSA
jgi:hypothetical protein